MKKSVMQRPMFAGMAPKSGSKGILSYFDEELDNEDYAERTPENLEIIANNLRGDMRSMDERYLELAQFVGEAAFDTPEEVITLMQQQMAQQPSQQPASAPAPQGAGGIAGLGGATAPQQPQNPQGIMQGIAEPQQPAPQQGMPQGPMAGQQGSMPPGQEPIKMANGGPVYRQAGSPPWGEIKSALDYFRSFPPLPPLGDTPEGRRQMGFMKYLPQGTIPSAGQTAPRSTPIPRVQLQQTAPMTGFLSGDAARFLQSGAAAPGGTLPQKIPFNVRAATAVSEAARGAVPFARELGRTLMSTPQGRAAAAIGAAGATALPFLMGDEKPTGDQPVYSEVPGVDAEGRYVPVLRTPEPTKAERQAVSQLGMGTVGPVRLGMADFGGTEDQEAAQTEQEPTQITPAPGVTVPAAGRSETAETPKDYRERVRDKMDVYSEFLGADPEARKAQALFLLAEAALNVAGATGRSVGERLAKGLKGLPAGMAAIGAEADKDKRAIAAAAISSVEQEYADARKAAVAMAKAAAGKKGPVNEKVQSLYTSIKARNPEMDDDAALQYAIDRENGTIYQDDKTKEEYDKINGEIRWTPYKPLGPNSVGYISPDNPFARTSEQVLEPVVAPDQRKALLEEREKIQRNIPIYDRYLADIYGDTVGILPTIQSGVSQVTLALFGDVGFGLTNVQKNAVRQKSALANEYVTRGLFRNNSRVSNLDMTRAEELAKDPNKLTQSAETVVSTIQNFAVQDMNRLAEIDHLLGLSPTLKQIDRIPSGAKTDPMPVVKGVEPLLRDAFMKRPNLTMHLQFPDGKIERIDRNHPYVQQLIQGTAQ
jgi:hypothetical protein